MQTKKTRFLFITEPISFQMISEPYKSFIMAHEDLSKSTLTNNSSKVLEEGVYTISETWEITGKNHVTIIGETDASGQPLTTIRLEGASTNYPPTMSGIYAITLSGSNQFPVLYRDGEF